ncbi:MAG: GlcG/HbpS family heme-binding protein [Pseudorhodobacter sp.]
MLNLEESRKLIAAVHAKGAELGLKPLSVVVLDAGGHVRAFERADGASVGRFEIARGKAYGCVMLGLGGSAIQARGESQAVFVDAMNGIYDGKFVPVKGGVLILDAAGNVMGAVGVTGDTSDNDTICALAGIEAIGLVGMA